VTATTESRPAGTENGADLDAEYEAALTEYRTWDRRAAESQSCDIAVAAQRSLERLRQLEAERHSGALRALEAEREADAT